VAYNPPVLSDFRSRFPEFNRVPDSIVELALAEALRAADETWTEGDYATAVLYFAAHLVLLSTRMGVGSDAASGGGAMGQAVRSVRYKDRAVQYYNVAGQSSGMGGGGNAPPADALDTTPYGQMYLMLVRRNVTSILVLDDYA
jgi:Protein of unknown function (DUF4054)